MEYAERGKCPKCGPGRRFLDYRLIHHAGRPWAFWTCLECRREYRAYPVAKLLGRRTGVTLIELLAVLTIAGIILGGIAYWGGRTKRAAVDSVQGIYSKAVNDLEMIGKDSPPVAVPVRGATVEGPRVW